MHSWVRPPSPAVGSCFRRNDENGGRNDEGDGGWIPVSVSGHEDRLFAGKTEGVMWDGGEGRFANRPYQMKMVRAGKRI